MMSCVARKAVVVAVLFFLFALPLLSIGQTYTQEERFETCCNNATSGAIAGTKYCNYRELQSVKSDQFDNADPKLESGVRIAHDNENQTSVNEAWAAFLPCLNNGKDNRDCCLKNWNDDVTTAKVCSPLCNGQLRAKDMDIKFLNSMSCYRYFHGALTCAVESA